MNRSCLAFTHALAIWIASCSAAWAASPQLSATTPYGFQRGTEVEVLFTGARLGDAQGVLLYDTGLTFSDFTAEADNKVKAKVTVAPDCRMGLHAFRLRTATGLSNLRTVSVGALPEVSETEPNSEFTEPQPMELGCVINGVITTEDVDYFVVEVKQGQRITAELEGLRLGNSEFDPYLAILNTDRFELARSDDTALLQQDCLCSLIAPADGKYIIQIRETAYGGSGTCRYRLHLGSFPRPRGVTPTGGKPGETLTFTWHGDAAGEFSTKITLPKTLGEFGLYAENQDGVAPSPNVIRIVDADHFQEVEPNNNFREASPGSAPGVMEGVIGEDGDADYFSFTAKKGEKFDIRVFARGALRSPLDAVMSVRNSKGASLGGADDVASRPDPEYKFTAPADDEYFVEVHDHLRGGGPLYFYRIEISQLEPSVTVSTPEKQRYVSTTLEVPAGNRMAIMFNAARANFGGDLQVQFGGLPQGVSYEAPVMPANRSEVPVLFTAGAMPGTAFLADATAVSTDEKVQCVSGFEQRTMLVRGQGNNDVWGHDAKAMPIAVTDKAPYSIKIIQPTAPITRSGALDLKVVAERAEGFDGAISIRMLYNPPGIGSSVSISIPAKENEVVLPLTANDGASIGAWPIVVTGSATIDGGKIEASTQMAQLEIVDRFFNFSFEKAAGELGQETDLIVNVEKRTDWEGTATVKLLGLPANTTCLTDEVTITQDSTQMVFRINIDEKARPGKNTSLVCRAFIDQNGESITTTLGSGELRIDKPLPAPVAAPVVAAAPKTDAPKPAAPAAAPVKRLSRLEQLRLEREKKLEAAGQ
ncbi:PPC domain-containing protein [Lignipirellula cremea]|uniref:Putative subtilase-type serine protease n=1 Tax=Lignipirellula cremea TaxID=2528010 RepID=A0A518E205_9BACT|nr:PPC domain-containing protein [Lignipirellula cremea]QDU98125.1 putative subtilase-type serine protease precursor [Lignipirellula cremea]